MIEEEWSEHLLPWVDLIKHQKMETSFVNCVTSLWSTVETGIVHDKDHKLHYVRNKCRKTIHLVVEVHTNKSRRSDEYLKNVKLG